MHVSIFRGAARLAAAIVSLLLATNALAQRPVLVILSQPAPNAGAEPFIDLAPHLASALSDAGKYEVVVYKSDLPAVKAALNAGKLTTQDLAAPVKLPVAHQVSEFLGAQYLVVLSAYNSKGEIATDCTIDLRVGAREWTTLTSGRLSTAKEPARKRMSLLESIHVVVGTLVDRIDKAAAAQPTQRAFGHDSPLPPDVASSVGVTRPSTATGAGVRPPDSPSIYELLIDRARRNGDIPNLVEGLRREINEKPRDIRLRRDLVKAYNDLGWHDQARVEAEHAVALAPNDGALHRLLGDALVESGDTGRAMQEYQQAVQLNGKDAANLVALGDALAHAGKSDDALKAYQDAVRAEPKSPLPHRRLARFYLESGHYTECVDEVKAAHDLMGAGEEAQLAGDHAALLTAVENTLLDSLGSLLADRTAFHNGAHNREDTFKDYTALHKRAEAVGAFLSSLPDTGFTRAQALYTQAAALVAQTIEKSLDYLETQNTSDDEASTLMRVEAAKQIGEASKALKAAAARQSQG